MHLSVSQRLIGIFLFSFLQSCGGGGGSVSENGGAPPYPDVPGGGEVAGERSFVRLINSVSQGSSRKTPWAGFWWPYTENGISRATSKYEAAGGTGGATGWELSHHGASVPGVQSWWGHCNGWAAAAVLFNEPRTAVTIGSTGFEVADRKALLSELGMEVTADFFGLRADSSSTSDPNFQDVWPNQFFLVVTNFVGQGLSVVMDRFTGNQVWNHPLAGYRISPVVPADYLGADPSAPGVFRINVSMQVWWVRDDVSGGHLTEAFAFSDGPSYESRTLRMELWLDGPVEFSENSITRSGNVILTRQGRSVTGGLWKNSGLELANSHPDYLWIPHDVSPSSGFTNPLVDHAFISRNGL